MLPQTVLPRHSRAGQRLGRITNVLGQVLRAEFAGDISQAGADLMACVAKRRDFVAAETAVLPHELVAGHQFRRPGRRHSGGSTPNRSPSGGTPGSGSPGSGGRAWEHPNADWPTSRVRGAIGRCCSASFGVCEAQWKSVALPWPSWQTVQPNSASGCGLPAAEKQIEPRMRGKGLGQGRRFIDPLMAGRAAVGAGNLPKMVVERQFRQPNLFHRRRSSLLARGAYDTAPGMLSTAAGGPPPTSTPSHPAASRQPRRRPRAADGSCSRFRR